MKRPPSPDLVGLRDKLQRLSEQGMTEHERNAARIRLERLEGRIDFTIPIVLTGDIFAKAVAPLRGEFKRLTLDLTANDPVACFVKWAIDAGFGVETRWAGVGTEPGRLHASLQARSVPNVSRAAFHIAESFGALWRAFRAFPGANDGDCRTFCLGLLDGMTGQQRQQGEKLPPKRAEAVVKKGRRKTLALVPALSIHPYEVALPLGYRVRMSAPIAELEADLQDVERRARLESK